MRERVTFVHQDPNLDPETLDNQEVGLLGPQIDSVRQDKLTIPLDELPPDLAGLLKSFESLHIRWASPSQYETLDPFTSRLSPGLHVSYTPAYVKARERYASQSCSLSCPVVDDLRLPHSKLSPKLCTWLQRFGPVDCSSPKVQPPCIIRAFSNHQLGLHRVYQEPSVY